MGTIRVGEQRLLENKAVLIDPPGAELLSYRKSAAVPGFEAQRKVQGDWRIVTSDTPYGRVATAICYDLDFPSFIRQVGLTGADLLLVPANDWEAVKQMHLVPAVFRAVENGVAIVRATSRGVSAAVDPLGRVLATMDHFATTERVMVAQMPLASVHTVYARFGDWFAWLCVAGLLTMIGWSFLHTGQVR
jgi:apolipoprotein N-acyltransferase